MKETMALAVLLFSACVVADPATTDQYWQYNNNIKISKLYVYWQESVTRVALDNGEVCFIAKSDKDLFALAMSMQAQQATGSMICQISDSFSFEGKDAKRVHRIVIN